MLPKERIKLSATTAAASVAAEKPETLIESLKQYRPHQQQQQQQQQQRPHSRNDRLKNPLLRPLTADREKLLSQDGILEAEKLSRQVNEAFKSGLLNLTPPSGGKTGGNHRGLPQLSPEKGAPTLKKLHPQQQQHQQTQCRTDRTTPSSVKPNIMSVSNMIQASGSSPRRPTGGGMDAEAIMNRYYGGDNMNYDEYMIEYQKWRTHCERNQINNPRVPKIRTSSSSSPTTTSYQQQQQQVQNQSRGQTYLQPAAVATTTSSSSSSRVEKQPPNYEEYQRKVSAQAQSSYHQSYHQQQPYYHDYYYQQQQQQQQQPVTGSGYYNPLSISQSGPGLNYTHSQGAAKRKSYPRHLPYEQQLPPSQQQQLGIADSQIKSHKKYQKSLTYTNLIDSALAVVRSSKELTQDQKEDYILSYMDPKGVHSSFLSPFGRQKRPPPPQQQQQQQQQQPQKAEQSVLRRLIQETIMKDTKNVGTQQVDMMTKKKRAMLMNTPSSSSSKAAMSSTSGSSIASSSASQSYPAQSINYDQNNHLGLTAAIEPTPQLSEAGPAAKTKQEKCLFCPESWKLEKDETLEKHYGKLKKVTLIYVGFEAYLYWFPVDFRPR